jgi:hypothetical protein
VPGRLAPGKKPLGPTGELWSARVIAWCHNAGRMREGCGAWADGALCCRICQNPRRAAGAIGKRGVCKVDSVLILVAGIESGMAEEDRVVGNGGHRAKRQKVSWAQVAMLPIALWTHADSHVDLWCVHPRCHSGIDPPS